MADVQEALKALANLPLDVRPPTWLIPINNIPPNELLACANGLLHVPTRTLLPATPLFYTHNAIEVHYDPDLPPPIEWKKFLVDIFGADAEAVSTLQEIFGYIMIPDTHQQKIFLIVGPKRSGKGTIARIITALLGQDNVCAPTLSSLSQNFGLAPLIGKQAAIIADARIGGSVDQHIIAERLLSISGEDSITIDRKYLPAWTGRLNIRFLILSNFLPKITDASGALPSRFVLLTLTKSFYGMEDLGLFDRLQKELPSILNWAIEGLIRLQHRGAFVQPASAFDAVQELEDLSSPVKTFISDRCELNPTYEIECQTLFTAWKEWCQTQGRDHVGTIQTLGRDLRAAAPDVKSAQHREGEERIRVYTGIRLAG